MSSEPETKVATAEKAEETKRWGQETGGQGQEKGGQAQEMAKGISVAAQQAVPDSTNISHGKTMEAKNQAMDILEQTGNKVVDVMESAKNTLSVWCMDTTGS